MSVLLDAGPIVALFDKDELHHELCRAALESTKGPLLTCEAVIVEACYLLRHTADAANELLLDVQDNAYTIEYQLAKRAKAVAQLMTKYASVPMNLADACLTDMATELGSGRILTLDSDFRVYRWGRNRPFELVLDV